MLEVVLAGTGGTMPLKHRWLCSCWIRQQAHTMLIDCGEGTQIALKCAGVSFQSLDLLCITHYHADHVSGLVGLLLSMGSEGRTAPLTIVGPRGLQRTVEGLRVIAPELPFPLILHELTQPEESLPFGDATLTAFALHHGVPCYGYCVDLPRTGKFDVARAQAAGIPLRLWSLLQKQASVTTEDGTVYYQSQVLGAPRKGLRLTYCTDTRPTACILDFAANADLFICEGMYGEEEKREKARKTAHMLFSEAAELAVRAHAKMLWLTHFSPSLPDPQAYRDAAAAIFPNTICGKDGMRITLRFPESDSKGVCT